MNGVNIPDDEAPIRCRSTSSGSQQTSVSSALAVKAGEIANGAAIEQRNIVNIRNGRCNIDTTNTNGRGITHNPND